MSTIFNSTPSMNTLPTALLLTCPRVAFFQRLWYRLLNGRCYEKGHRIRRCQALVSFCEKDVSRMIASLLIKSHWAVQNNVNNPLMCRSKKGWIVLSSSWMSIVAFLIRTAIGPVITIKQPVLAIRELHALLLHEMQPGIPTHCVFSRCKDVIFCFQWP